MIVGINAFKHLIFLYPIIVVCGGQLNGPNGIIEFNSSTIADRPSPWDPPRCEWNVTVRPGRTIEVMFIELDVRNTGPNGCSEHYVMVRTTGIMNYEYVKT